MATASGVAIIGWIVWRGWRIHPPPGMVLVPAGAYPVGGGGAPGRDSTTVRLDAFFIDSAEVGVAAYRRYLDSTRARPPWTQPPPDHWPATGVLWSEAVAYCAWRQRGGRRTGASRRRTRAVRGADRSPECSVPIPSRAHPRARSGCECAADARAPLRPSDRLCPHMASIAIFK